MVLAFYFSYDLYVDNKPVKATVSQVDSCVFTSQVGNERYLILNTCNNSIKEFTPHKNSLDARSIDSIIIFSNELNQAKLLTSIEVEKFAEDWNKSTTHGYSDEPFDSAFSLYTPFQYKLTVFSKGTQRSFFGFNYIVLDSSNWKYKMSSTRDLDYFHHYWRK